MLSVIECVDRLCFSRQVIAEIYHVSSFDVFKECFNVGGSA